MNMAVNPLDVLKRDSLTGRLRREDKAAELDGKRVEVRHTRPAQILFRTTVEKKKQLERLAELSERAKAEVLEKALDLYELVLLEEMKEEVGPKKGKRK